MERIQQALDKAKEERSRIAGTEGTAPPALTPTTEIESGGKIQYNQTRSFTVSANKLQQMRIVKGLAQGVVTDAYNMLRTQVLQKMQQNNWKTLAITSPGQGEGKSLTAINLAISIAMEVHTTVLLVDADLRHPSIHQYFGMGTCAGLSNYLLEDKPLESMLVNPAGIERFILLPGGQAMQNSAEMLNSPKMKRLVNEFSNRYPNRIIIFDLPPILSTADAMAFSPFVDAALLVIEEGKTSEEDLSRAISLLGKEKLLGTLLNKTYLSKQTLQNAYG